ncbi:hypothetical protein NITUZ_40471 [Candidatus Nitrosotenuis uzonensis]|uniref:Uncharacterized protein n=2 Tax=Candidatus Nitrosotenuis uzonensis TaxID=1407055 RepID=V6AUU1_9ARCH|nr:hypothetical protein NITUZ_40471 [Candidatus Nitrosotenuis uzonensis]
MYCDGRPVPVPNDPIAEGALRAILEKMAKARKIF